MMVTKKALSRRAVLRGMGVTLALPLLDSMVPAFAGAREVLTPKRRLGVIYVPNGIMMQNWTPAEEGQGFSFTPTLKPLERFRDHLTVVTGLKGNPGGGPHAGASTRFLTNVAAKQDNANIMAGTSVDQLVAGEFGKTTQLTSLELGLDTRDFAGSCDIGYSCAYTNTISWKDPSTPLPTENDPRAVFERLFGDSGTTDGPTRLARARRDRSILDSITEKTAALASQLGSADRHKIAQYTESIRDVERRIQRAEADSAAALPEVEQPAGVPSLYSEHAKLMFDMQVLAYQSDLTRVITFMMGREISGRSYAEIGVPDAHHPISHHQNIPENIAKLCKINLFHTTLLSYYVEKLAATEDGAGSLLDHTLLIYGSGMSDSNLHSPENLPILLAGGAINQVKGGRHLKVAGNAPLANFHLTLLDRLNIQAETLGNSTGRLQTLPL